MHTIEELPHEGWNEIELEPPGVGPVRFVRYVSGEEGKNTCELHELDFVGVPVGLPDDDGRCRITVTAETTDPLCRDLSCYQANPCSQDKTSIVRDKTIGLIQFLRIMQYIWISFWILLSSSKAGSDNTCTLRQHVRRRQIRTV